MIFEKIKVQLAALFPVVEKSVETTEESTEEKESKVVKRENGLLECDYDKNGYHLDIQVASDQVIQAVNLLDENEFFIESITGVDWIKENELEVVYDFCRYDFDLCRVVVRTRLDRENPSVPTITEIYSGANWHERETHDFFGIKFEGHPHLIPLLLPEDADFHPLLKDFKA